MDWHRHSDLVGKHAFLSPSSYRWINYPKERLRTLYDAQVAKARGTEDHEFAATCIKRRQKLPKSKSTLNMYVNDAIGFKMTPELPLYFSSNCFGTADAICFRKNVLRIHDLKTGVTPAHMEQLIIYAALFYLEYGEKPEKCETVLRLYQNNEYTEYIPSPDEIGHFMKCIIECDKSVNEIIMEEGVPR